MLNRYRFVLVLVAMMLMVLPMSLFAQHTEMDRDAMIAVWERFDKELWQGWNFDIVEEILADDFVMHSWGYPPQNREAYVAGWIVGSSITFPEYTMDHHILLIDGDYLVVDDNWGGVFENEFNGQPPTGEEVRVNGMEIFRFEEGKIAELWVLYDATPFMLQMGFMPTEEEVLPDVPWDIAMGETTSTAEENKAIQIKQIDYVNTHDIDAYYANFIEDGVVHEMLRGDLTIDETKQLMTEINTAFPNGAAVNPVYFAEGDLAVVVYTAVLEEDKLFYGMVIVDRFEDGKIVEEWWLYDSFGLNQQLAELASEDS